MEKFITVNPDLQENLAIPPCSKTKFCASAGKEDALIPKPQDEP